MKQRLSRFKKSAAPALALLFCFFANALHAQHTTPTINGIFDGASVYPNSLTSDGRTWYMTWDNTNLYVFITAVPGGNRVLMYFDTNPSIPVNGGTNGSVVGINYSNTNLVRLPFSAEAFVALETGYRQLNTCFTGTSFGGAQNVTSAPGWAFAENSGNFEVQIPWNAINNNLGRPAAFNWFGYITDNNTGGNYFAKVPTANPGGIIGTTLPNASNTAGYERYFKITNTNNSTSTNPFSLDCYTFVRHTGTDATSFGAITVEDFTMNTASRSITRASDGSSWTINGALRIYQGTVNFGLNTGSCTVSDSIAIASGGTLTLSPTSNALTANGHFRIDGTFNANNSTVRFAGNNNTQAVSGSASPVTFYNIVVSKQNSRTELVLPASLSYNNPLHFGHGTMTINNFTLDSGLVYLSPITGTGTFTRTISGNVTIGSTPSSIIGDGAPSTPIRANTVLIINNRAGATVNTTVSGNIQEGPGLGYVTLILAGKDCNSSSSSTLTVNGDVTFNTRPFSWNGNGTTPPSGVGSMTFNFAGNISITNSLSIFNGDRAGTSSPPTINLTGSNKTVDILPVVFLGGGPTTGGTNAQANWVIPSTASITIPSTGALAINMGRTLTVNGTLTCANGAQLIGTATGSSSGDPTFALGSSGVLRVADVDGLGDGTQLDPPSNFPLFILRTSPSSSSPDEWDLLSINSNGTIEYNGTSAQAVTPRNGSDRYNTLIFSGGSTKTVGGNINFNGNVTINAGTTVDGGTFIFNATQSGLSVNIDGTFRTANTNGFSGSSNTAIRDNNSPTVNLNTGSTVDYNATAPQTVTVTNYDNLTLSGGSGANKTLSESGIFDVTGTLTLDCGVVDLNGGEIRIDNTAPSSVVRTNGHINNALERGINDASSGSYLFPIGDASTYRPVTLTAQASTFNAFLRGRLENSPGSNISSSYQSPLVGVSQLRYYEFENRSDVATIDVTQASLQVSSDDGALTPANTRVATFLDGDSQWSNRGGSISSVPSTITSSAFSNAIPAVSNNFWYAALGTTNIGDNPLPVELLSFTATSTAQGIKLAWETASEHESRGFTLLRKPHGESTWTEVASYQTDNALRAQNSLNGASYSFTDKTPLEVGKSYDYQLRETGFDGQVAMLETVTLTVRFNAARAYELAQNYPNPFNPTTTIRYQIPTAEVVSLKVYDVLGKEVATLVSGRQEAGNYAVPFNASGLSSGMYFYRLQAGSFVETRKMMLVK